MKTAETSFDGVAADFYRYERTVRGAVRYDLVHENLAPYLADSTKNILDVCGGSGPDTAWVASLGHTVLLVEPSKEQLGIAMKDRFPKLGKDTMALIDTQQGMLSTLPDGLHGTFDVVMSHGVAMYQEDPDAYWRDCIKFIKPGGLLSILEKGYGGTAMRLTREDKLEELQAFLSSRRVVNNMGREVWAFTFDGLQKSLRQLDCEVVFKAGIRNITDHMRQPKTELTDSQWKELLDEERILSHDIEEMHRSQMLQVIVQKK